MHHLVSKFGVSQEGEEKMKVEICMLVCAAAQCYFESRMCTKCVLIKSCHGSYKRIIMHEKYGRPDSNGFQLK